MKQASSSNASDFIRFENNYFSLIALDRTTPIGLIVVKLRSLSPPVAMLREAYIDIIEVHPYYQRRGIGNELMERVIAWAKDNNVSQIRAWSEEIRDEEKRYGFYVAKRIQE